MKKLMYIIAVCLAFATCSKVEQEVDPSPESPTSFKKGQKVTLSYTTDVQSKVSSSIDASGISFTWEEGDQILVKVGGSTGTFTLTKGAGTATAEFSGGNACGWNNIRCAVSYIDSEPVITDISGW